MVETRCREEALRGLGLFAGGFTFRQIGLDAKYRFFGELIAGQESETGDGDRNEDAAVDEA